MENLFLFAIFTTILYVFMKFIEMKYLDKEFKPMKVVIRDALLVFGCSLLGAYGFFSSNTSFSDLLNIVTENKTLKLENAQIFTDAPNF